MQYAHSLVRDALLAAEGGWFVHPPYAINDTYIHCARNKAVKAFLESGYEQLVFIDADLGWDSNGLLKLLQTPGDIVGGLYRAKDPALGTDYPCNISGLITYPACEIQSLPTGFMRISRDCAAQMFAKYDGRPFDHVVSGGEERGEDIVFCDRARKHGFSVWARFDIEFEHVGPFAWKGRAADHFFEKETLNV
jgi:glycosyltransferase involved in cell wall biosynthesis